MNMVVNYCRVCGVPIPEGQTICSMCYGDPDHGRDGHYRQMLEDMAEKQQAREAEERYAERLEEENIPTKDKKRNDK